MFLPHQSIFGSTFDTKVQPAKSSASTLHNIIDLDGPSSHASYFPGDYSSLYLEESIDIDDYAKMLAHFDNVDIPPGIEANIPYFLPLSDSHKSNLEAISGSSSSLKAQCDGFNSPSWKIAKASKIKAKQYNYSSLDSQNDSTILGPGISSTWKLPQTSSCKTQHSYLQHKGRSFNISARVELPKFQTETQNNGLPAKQGFSIETEETMRKLKDFKQFDTVEDYSDHRFTVKSRLTMQKNRAKRIQEEWKILEKDLPDTIFVRVYETRMDHLRAVILGAERTPYHDGLFFFDVSFPIECLSQCTTNMC